MVQLTGYITGLPLEANFIAPVRLVINRMTRTAARAMSGRSLDGRGRGVDCPSHQARLGSLKLVSKALSESGTAREALGWNTRGPRNGCTESGHVGEKADHMRLDFLFDHEND
jgi:hypothetical protein